MATKGLALPGDQLAFEIMNLISHLSQNLLVERRRLLRIRREEMLRHGVLNLPLDKRVDVGGQNMGEVARDIGAGNDLLNLDGKVLKGNQQSEVNEHC